MAWEMDKSCLTKEVSHDCMRRRELRDRRCSAWMWDHWRLTWPRRKFSHPMRSCSCAANKVMGSAEGQKRRTWWEEREAMKQEEIEGWVSTEESQWENLPTADRKVADMRGSRQEITCRVVSGL